MVYFTMVIKIIEFSLPGGGGGMAAQMARGLLLRRLRKFRDDYKFDFVCNTEGYILQVWFKDERAYTVFSLTYDTKDGWREYRIVEKEEPNERDF